MSDAALIMFPNREVDHRYRQDCSHLAMHLRRAALSVIEKYQTGLSCYELRAISRIMTVVC